jgi:hypothetical protein
MVIGLALLFATVGCRKATLESALPACIEERVNPRGTGGFEPRPLEVWQWEVDGKTYYYCLNDCCDAFNLLYDEDCKRVCAPDGGMTGAGDQNCPTWQGTITKTLLWQGN